MKSGLRFLLWFLCAWMLTVGLACSNDDDDSGGANDDDDGSDLGPPENSPFAANRDPDQTKSSDRLSGKVEMIRDEWGIPHIYAESLLDASFVHGYIAAHDRLWQMDALRHAGQGRLTEMLGAGVLEFDKEFRGAFMGADGVSVHQKTVDQMRPELREILDRYAEGVNFYLEELRAGQHEMSIHYFSPLLEIQNHTPDTIPDWEPVDTLSLARFFLWYLSDGYGAETGLAELAAALPPEMFRDLIRVAPSDPTSALPEFFDSEFYDPNAAPKPIGKRSAPRPTNGAPFEPIQLEALKSLYDGIDFAGLRERQKGLAEVLPMLGQDKGSNNWVVDDHLTAGGHVLVANDPHLPFMNPPIWYLHHVDTKLYGGGDASEEPVNVIGQAFAGVPFPVMGHNEYVAWGGTTTYYDTTDVYVETLNDAGDAVWFEGEWVPIIQYVEEFKIGPQPDAEVMTGVIEYVPHHGPIRPGSKSGGKAITVRWNGLWPSDEVESMLGWAYAKNVSEFMEASNHFSIGATNWMAGDVEGNIGYNPHVRLPIRERLDPDFPPYMPMPGDGGYEWVGWVPDDRLPHTYNRPEGYIVTANNDIAGTTLDNDLLNDPEYLQSVVNVGQRGYRAGRITERIEDQIDDGEPFTMEDMIDLQADIVTLEARRFMPFLLAVTDNRPGDVAALGLQEAFDRLAGWNFNTPSGADADYRTDGGPNPQEIDESIASTIFYAFIVRFFNMTLDDDTEPYGIVTGYSKSRALLHVLENPAQTHHGMDYFDDLRTPEVETLDDIVLKAMVETVAWLSGEDAFMTNDMSQWRWGQLHVVEIPDIFGLLMPLSFNGLGSHPRGGGNYTVDVGKHAIHHEDDPTGFSYSQGPSNRFVAEMIPGAIRSVNSLPGGQIDNPDDPHYDDLLPMWLRNESFPYYFYVEDVADHMESYTLWVPSDE